MTSFYLKWKLEKNYVGIFMNYETISNKKSNKNLNKGKLCNILRGKKYVMSILFRRHETSDEIEKRNKW